MTKKKIYIASPLGFYESDRLFLREQIIPVFNESGYDYIDPWTHAPLDVLSKIQQMDYGVERKKAYEKMNHMIGAQNAQWIDESIGILAILDGSDVDSGTAAEIGYCAGQSKPILGYRSDFRLSADNEGSIVNLQVEYFIRKNSGIIVTTLEDIRTNLSNIFQ